MTRVTWTKKTAALRSSASSAPQSLGISVLGLYGSPLIFVYTVLTTQRNPNLPSWCPDLHFKSVSDILADHQGYHASFNIQTTTEIRYDDGDMRKLRAKGIIVDTVGSVIDEEWSDDHDVQHLEGSLCRSARQHHIVLSQNYITVTKKFVKAEDLWQVFCEQLEEQHGMKSWQ